jgi:hypothetical protein
MRLYRHKRSNLKCCSFEVNRPVNGSVVLALNNVQEIPLCSFHLKRRRNGS